MLQDSCSGLQVFDKCSRGSACPRIPVFMSACSGFSVPCAGFSVPCSCSPVSRLAVPSSHLECHPAAAGGGSSFSVPCSCFPYYQNSCFPVPGSPFRVPISSAILQLQEAGRLHILKNRWWKQRRGGGKCDVRGP